MQNVSEKFLTNVKNHKMRILCDIGIYRHVKFSGNLSSDYDFEIVTSPGTLLIKGAMGTFVFGGIEDLFELFRSPEESLKIDPEYWSEKVISESEPRTSFSTEKFTTEIRKFLENNEAKQSVKYMAEEEIIPFAHINERLALESVMGFEFEGFTFEGFEEINTSELTYRFLWNCYAIVWAIRQYDEQLLARLKIIKAA